MVVTHKGCGGEVAEIMLVPRAFAIEAYEIDGEVYYEEAGPFDVDKELEIAGMTDPVHDCYYCPRCKERVPEAEMDSGIAGQ